MMIGLIGLLLAVAPTVLTSPVALAAPGVDNPTSYSPSDASLTSTPTYLTDRAAVSPSGVKNGQDYDHYCKADWQGISQLAGTTAGQPTRITSQVSKRSTAPALAGNNGLMYMNQWFNRYQSNPYFRVVWATDFATTDSKLTLQVGDNWQPGVHTGGIPGTFTPYSTDGATLISQIPIRSGAAKFRTYDWATYVLGLQGQAPYNTATSYIPGPYTGVNTNLFNLNPAVQTVPAPPPYTDPFYPVADQYLPNVDPNNPNSFANKISYDPATKTITVDLGDQPAGAMIVFEINGISNKGVSFATDEVYELTGTFTGDYPTTHPENTVCYPVEVKWNKVDAETQALLPGSGWSLTPTGDTSRVTTNVTVTDADGTPGTDTDTTAGRLTVGTSSTSRVFQPGTWNLSETQAPPGYAPGADKTVTLNFENQTVDLGDVANTNEAPTITAPNVNVPKGSQFDPVTGVTAADKEDGDITAKVTVTDLGGFDTNTPGTYTITYSVTDAGGKTTTQTRRVTVTATVTQTVASPGPSSTHSTSAQPSPGASSSATEPPDDSLANTGADISPALLVGAVLLLGSGIVLIVGRRRKH